MTRDTGRTAAFRSVMLVLSGASGLCGLLSLGGFASQTLDALAQLAPLWLSASVAIAMPAWLVRARAAIALAFVGIVCGALLVIPPLVAASLEPSPPGSPPDLTVIQFNVWKLNQDPDATAAWIIAQNADVVALEELEGRSASILRRLEQAGYRSAGRCRKPLGCRSIVLTKLQVMDGDSLATAPNWISASYLTIHMPQGPVAVAAAHTSWPWPPARVAAQLNDLNEAVAQLPADCKIVAGDFNSSPWSFSLRVEERELELPRRTRVIPSWPARKTTGINFPPPFSIFAIDHVFASRCWRRGDAVSGPRLGSDHLPVIVRLWR